MAFKLRVITTEEWGAKAPRNAPFARTIPQYIVVHHVDSPNPPNDSSRRTEDGAKRLARSIQHFHMTAPDRRWNDTGQNFLNTTGGFLLEGRHGTLDAVKKGQCVQSAHAAKGDGLFLSYGNQGPGIENEGNFNAFDMIDGQRESLVKLCAELCKACNLKPEHIMGHREFASTDCPGDLLYEQLPQLRLDVAKKLDVEIPPGREQNRWPIGVVVRNGDRGPTVLLLQNALKLAGHDPGTLDGLFGDRVRTAVIAYQKAKNLTASGMFDRRTRESLGV